ncbi:MAG: type I-C CRISPR-associated protein Cas7/Csd2 [Ignavibacteriaceae bacterium]
METKEPLKNKIDFAVILSVNKANPNGDPLSGNRPRTDYEGYGELSDVCIKRKIRNRLMDLDHEIFVQSDDNRKDEYRSLRSRAEGVLKSVDMSDDKKFREAACKQWIDVRAFGQVFAYKAGGKKAKKAKESTEGTEDKSEDASVSIGIRGPVSVHPAFSVASVNDRVASIQITKSVSGEGDGAKKASDTMGMKHRVNHGVYVFYGSINPQLASKTLFSDEDAKAIKEALRTLFVNDESSARPAGSMEVHKLYWWEQKQGEKQYSSAKVHRTVRDRVKPNKEEPKSISDYYIPDASEINKELPGLEVEIIDGE